MLVVVVLVLMVAMIVVDVVKVPTVRQSLVPAVCAVNVHVAGVRLVGFSLAIGALAARLVVDGRSLGRCVRSVHGPIICPPARETPVVEHFAA